MVSKNVNLSLKARARHYRKQKSLGQNFLISEPVLDFIVDCANLDPKTDIVLEIGAGIGFLTERLVKKAKVVHAIELDSRACFHLDMLKISNSNFQYLNADFLSLRFRDIFGDELLTDIKAGNKPKIKVVANIPYQITTKIILNLLGEIGFPSEAKEYLDSITLLVQKEYAERITAEPGIKAYGASTVFSDYWCDKELLLDVPAECFDPIPKVDSAVIQLRVKEMPSLHVEEPKKFRRLIKAIFANRRKVLSNSLKAAGYDQEKIKALNLDPKLRGETLSLTEMYDLAVKLS